MLPFNIIVAVDEEFGIGKDGVLPWHLSGDMRHFKTVTTQTASQNVSNVVIMGRKTWDSIPVKFRPLPGRLNCVLTRKKNAAFPDGVMVARGLPEAFEAISQQWEGRFESLFVIGGAEIFEACMSLNCCQKIYLTEIQHDYHCDVFFPKDFLTVFKKDHESPLMHENEIDYIFSEYIHVK